MNLSDFRHPNSFSAPRVSVSNSKKVVFSQRQIQTYLESAHPA